MQQSHIVVEMMKIFQECARSPAAAPSLRVANKLAVTVCVCVQVATAYALCNNIMGLSAVETCAF